ncbi:fungal-specific transcription factor domain-containing protein [Aspergillus minisclerotigenes]|uniref:Fungal-specific transcription factor domain-containing protein n=1 Tax=Aspergillus minisclerotigenes TaxID=656917 RepID=A0A5N6IVC5_9EURO|nr:fungal-specific transcription factor domain-containing protein [Aspergillus minisclerotigenes]
MERILGDPPNRRAVNACLRCRQHKIKCSGECPCGNCKRRKAKCIFEGDENKIHITKKHLAELRCRMAELERENRDLKQRLSSSSEKTSVMDPVGHGGLVDGQTNTCHGIVNPLSTGPPKYVRDLAGNPHYLGHTSNWSLTIRLLHLTHQARRSCPFPSAAQHTDATTYDLGWSGLRTTVIPDLKELPSLDYALFLTNAVKFHTGQIFHLFDEPAFLGQLHDFYENPAEKVHTTGLWYIHFSVIMALGKAFTGTKRRGSVPPGANLFMAAFMMLPDYCYLWRDPSTSAELFCSMALYLQSIDWRTPAYDMIGRALRMLLVHGYHTNIPSGTLDERETQRSRNVWWTVFIIERQFTVLMGVPLGINDNEISTPLPAYPDSPHKSITMTMHVKLSQAFGQVMDTLYRKDRQVDSNLVRSTQRVLRSVANVAPELTGYFPVPEKGSVNGISRVSGYLNLLYQQCADIATPIPAAMKLLLQMCLESAKKTIDILRAFQDQNLLETFLPFDLDSAVSAGLVICMANLVNFNLIEDCSYLRDTLFDILDHLISEGNLVAVDHKMALEQLENFSKSLHAQTNDVNHWFQLEEAGIVARGHLNSSEMICIDGAVQCDGAASGIGDVNAGMMADSSDPVDPYDWEQELIPAQLMTVVDLLDGASVLDWATFAGNPSTLDGQEDGIND